MFRANGCERRGQIACIGEIIDADNGNVFSHLDPTLTKGTLSPREPAHLSIEEASGRFPDSMAFFVSWIAFFRFEPLRDPDVL